ncbi:lmo0937 family membrane protein [Jeotgalibaca porci]|nr:lmo0937 family membrane protein [Jeotgalibaca porci]
MMGNLLWTIIVVLVALWLIGLVLEIGGALIHFLLIIAGIIFVYQLITGKRKL